MSEEMKEVLTNVEKALAIAELRRTIKTGKAPTKFELLPDKVRRKLPPIYSQEEVTDPVVWVKYFTPDSNWTWYATEFDGEDQFFGLVEGIEAELGYFSLHQLWKLRGQLGLPVERDIYFKPKPLSEVRRTTRVWKIK